MLDCYIRVTALSARISLVIHAKYLGIDNCDKHLNWTKHIKPKQILQEVSYNITCVNVLIKSNTSLYYLCLPLGLQHIESRNHVLSEQEAMFSVLFT